VLGQVLEGAVIGQQYNPVVGQRDFPVVEKPDLAAEIWHTGFLIDKQEVGATRIKRISGGDIHNFHFLLLKLVKAEVGEGRGLPALEEALGGHALLVEAGLEKAVLLCIRVDLIVGEHLGASDGKGHGHEGVEGQRLLAAGGQGALDVGHVLPREVVGDY
jgi:hypothetical protein